MDPDHVHVVPGMARIAGRDLARRVRARAPDRHDDDELLAPGLVRAEVLAQDEVLGVAVVTARLERERNDVVIARAARRLAEHDRMTLEHLERFHRCRCGRVGEFRRWRSVTVHVQDAAGRGEHQQGRGQFDEAARAQSSDPVRSSCRRVRAGAGPAVHEAAAFYPTGLRRCARCERLTRTVGLRSGRASRPDAPAGCRRIGQPPR